MPVTVASQLQLMYNIQLGPQTLLIINIHRYTQRALILFEVSMLVHI